jgi:tetratricopeptide (TPR) repeat protein
MKAKSIIYLLLLCFTHNLVLGQELIYEKIQTDELAVCSIRETETDACITIIADKSLQLGFRSSNERLEEFMYNKEDIGSQTHYYMRFKTDPDHNMDRRFEVFTKINPNPLIIELSWLLPNKLEIYSVTAIPCYESVFREGNTLFLAGKYQDAREKYVKAQSCYDAPLDGELEKKIVQIDSLITWIEKANESMSLLDYNTAIIYYWKVTNVNSFDQPIIAKRNTAIQKQMAYCTKCLNIANRYYKEHEYDNAMELYQRAIDQDCNDKDSCQIKIEKIKDIIVSKRNRYKVFTLELGISKFEEPRLMLPISFSVGRYSDHKAGGYFSFATNPAFFNMLRSDYSKATQADIGISFGVNFRPIKPRITQYVPLWLYFGTGYTFMGAYLYQDASGEEVRYEGGELPDAKLKFTAYHAIPFETGLLLKLKWFALRYTFQYRFATKLDTQEYIQPFMHSFGIGVCF